MSLAMRTIISLAESINGWYQTELIKPRRPWRNAAHVTAETAGYIDWFNHKRLYEYCGDMPPAEFWKSFTIVTVTQTK